MQRNEGTVDRVIRGVVVAPLAVAVALLVGPATGLGVVALVVGAVMLVTAVAGFCPLYRLFGIRTCPVPDRR